ncbi:MULTISPECIES: hypothetical protein [unclassified Arthrobacter]|nr:MULTISPECIES: hypothetical protein [unclassified Arthrobacter]MDT0196875.1 hypothetical protein [Arthrobacter sp. AB6]
MNHLMYPLIARAAETPAIKPAVELGTPLLLTGFVLAFVAWIPVGGLGI